MVRAGVTAAVTVAVVALFDCGPAEAEDPVTSPIAGSSWRFAEIMGVAPPKSVQPTLQLSVDGAATGDTGCNQFSGHYVSVGPELSFSDLSYTKMSCGAEAMRVERTVQAALTRTSSMTTPPGELDLVASDGTVLARLTAAT